MIFNRTDDVTLKPIYLAAAVLGGIVFIIGVVGTAWYRVWLMFPLGGLTSLIGVMKFRNAGRTIMKVEVKSEEVELTYVDEKTERILHKRLRFALAVTRGGTEVKKLRLLAARPWQDDSFRLLGELNLAKWPELQQLASTLAHREVETTKWELAIGREARILFSMIRSGIEDGSARRVSSALLGMDDIFVDPKPKKKQAPIVKDSPSGGDLK